jgi:hypothetical protein
VLSTIPSHLAPRCCTVVFLSQVEDGGGCGPPAVNSEHEKEPGRFTQYCGKFATVRISLDMAHWLETGYAIRLAHDAIC